MPIPTIDIVIVDFNSGPALRACLESIVVARTPEVVISRVCLVDNASSPPSAEAALGLGLPIDLTTNQDNRGFAAACNQGATGSKADYLLFLNPDAVLRPDSLSVPILFMEEAAHATVGICGIQLVDESGRVHRSCARFPTPSNYLIHLLGLNRLSPSIFRPQFMEEWDHGRTQSVDQVIGAFFLARRSLFERLNGFDERFFLYFEEVDFSYRARNLGWATYYVSGTRAFHQGGGTSSKALRLRLYHSLKSRILYAEKHFSSLKTQVVKIEALFLEPGLRLAQSALRRSPYSVGAICSVFPRLWSELLPGRASEARRIGKGLS